MISQHARKRIYTAVKIRLFAYLDLDHLDLIFVFRRLVLQPTTSTRLSTTPSFLNAAECVSHLLQSLPPQLRVIGEKGWAWRIVHGNSDLGESFCY